MRDLILNEIKNNPQACNFDEIPQGAGEFGLEATNPIPVKGILTNNIYLSRLLLEDNSQIKWRRIGSTVAANIEKPIDIYKIFNMKGNTVCLLYISSYHLKISEKCPKGFTLKK